MVHCCNIEIYYQVIWLWHSNQTIFIICDLYTFSTIVSSQPNFINNRQFSIRRKRIRNSSHHPRKELAERSQLPSSITGRRRPDGSLPGDALGSSLRSKCTLGPSKPSKNTAKTSLWWHTACVGHTPRKPPNKPFRIPNAFQPVCGLAGPSLVRNIMNNRRVRWRSMNMNMAFVRFSALMSFLA